MGSIGTASPPSPRRGSNSRRDKWSTCAWLALFVVRQKARALNKAITTTEHAYRSEFNALLSTHATLPRWKTHPRNAVRFKETIVRSGNDCFHLLTLERCLPGSFFCATHTGGNDPSASLVLDPFLLAVHRSNTRSMVWCWRAVDDLPDVVEMIAQWECQ